MHGPTHRAEVFITNDGLLKRLVVLQQCLRQWSSTTGEHACRFLNRARFYRDYRQYTAVIDNFYRHTWLQFILCP